MNSRKLSSAPFTICLLLTIATALAFSIASVQALAHGIVENASCFDCVCNCYNYDASYELCNVQSDGGCAYSAQCIKCNNGYNGCACTPKVNYCQAITNHFGSVSYSDNRIVSSNATINCPTNGFAVQLGPSVTTCRADGEAHGRWDHHGACVPLANYCPPLPSSDSFAQFTAPRYSPGDYSRTLGSEVFFYCGPGTYETRERIVCQYQTLTSGKWSKTPSCQAKAYYCNTTSVLSLGGHTTQVIHTSSVDTFVGGKVYFSCNSTSLELIGSTYATCIPYTSSHSDWHFEVPTLFPMCVRKKNICPIPTAAANAVITYDFPRRVDDQAHHRCKPGYMASGGFASWTSYCQANGQWNDTRTCTQINNYCPHFSTVSIHLGSVHSPVSYTIDSVLSVTCNPGTLRSSNEPIKCIPGNTTNAGVWAPIPQCKSCPTGHSCDGSTAPTLCPAGTYWDRINSSACILCPDDSYSEPGSDACVCNAGFYLLGLDCVPNGGYLSGKNVHYINSGTSLSVLVKNAANQNFPSCSLYLNSTTPVNVPFSLGSLGSFSHVFESFQNPVGISVEYYTISLWGCAQTAVFDSITVIVTNAQVGAGGHVNFAASQPPPIVTRNVSKQFSVPLKRTGSLVNSISGQIITSFVNADGNDEFIHSDFTFLSGASSAVATIAYDHVELELSPLQTFLHLSISNYGSDFSVGSNSTMNVFLRDEYYYGLFAMSSDSSVELNRGQDFCVRLHEDSFTRYNFPFANGQLVLLEAMSETAILGIDFDFVPVIAPFSDFLSSVCGQVYIRPYATTATKFSIRASIISGQAVFAPNHDQVQFTILESPLGLFTINNPVGSPLVVVRHPASMPFYPPASFEALRMRQDDNIERLVRFNQLPNPGFYNQGHPDFYIPSYQNSASFTVTFPGSYDNGFSLVLTVSAYADYVSPNVVHTFMMLLLPENYPLARASLYLLDGANSFESPEVFSPGVPPSLHLANENYSPGASVTYSINNFAFVPSSGLFLPYNQTHQPTSTAPFTLMVNINETSNANFEFVHYSLSTLQEPLLRKNFGIFNPDLFFVLDSKHPSGIFFILDSRIHVVEGDSFFATVKRGGGSSTALNVNWVIYPANSNLQGGDIPLNSLQGTVSSNKAASSDVINVSLISDNETPEPSRVYFFELVPPNANNFRLGYRRRATITVYDNDFGSGIFVMSDEGRPYKFNTALLGANEVFKFINVKVDRTYSYFDRVLLTAKFSDVPLNSAHILHEFGISDYKAAVSDVHYNRMQSQMNCVFEDGDQSCYFRIAIFKHAVAILAAEPDPVIQIELQLPEENENDEPNSLSAGLGDALTMHILIYNDPSELPDNHGGDNNNNNNSGGGDMSEAASAAAATGVALLGLLVIVLVAVALRRRRRRRNAASNRSNLKSKDKKSKDLEMNSLSSSVTGLYAELGAPKTSPNSNDVYVSDTYVTANSTALYEDAGEVKRKSLDPKKSSMIAPASSDNNYVYSTGNIDLYGSSIDGTSNKQQQPQYQYMTPGGKNDRSNENDSSAYLSPQDINNNVGQYEVPVSRQSGASRQSGLPIINAAGAAGRISNVDLYGSYISDEPTRADLEIGQSIGMGEFGDVCLGQLKVSPQWVAKLGGRGIVLDKPNSVGKIPVAVKTMKMNASAQSKNDFVAEVRTMSNFVHPNVVLQLAAFVDSEPNVLVLEYLPHGDLRSFLQKLQAASVSLTLVEFLSILRDISSGMQYLESLHFVHRDLAARNCLVASGLRIKVSDFGLSRQIEDSDYYKMETKSRLPVKWMSPEAILFRKFSPASDVWSFSVTAWEVSSYGETPLKEFTTAQFVAACEENTIPELVKPSMCPDSVWNIVKRCRSMNPSDRPSFKDIYSFINGALAMSTETVRDLPSLISKK